MTCTRCKKQTDRIASAFGGFEHGIWFEERLCAACTDADLDAMARRVIANLDRWVAAQRKKKEKDVRESKPHGEPTLDQLSRDRNLIARIDEFGKGLSSWEIDFVESCTRRLDEGSPLSAKQRQTAEEIDGRRVR